MRILATHGRSEPFSYIRATLGIRRLPGRRVPLLTSAELRGEAEADTALLTVAGEDLGVSPRDVIAVTVGAVRCEVSSVTKTRLEALCPSSLELHGLPSVITGTGGRGSGCTLLEANLTSSAARTRQFAVARAGAIRSRVSEPAETLMATVTGLIDVMQGFLAQLKDTATTNGALSDVVVLLPALIGKIEPRHGPKSCPGSSGNVRTAPTSVRPRPPF